MNSPSQLALKSIEYRRSILTMIKRCGAGHTGGSLSCVDILNVLYNGVMDLTPANFDSTDRDHFVQSKGHCVEALYSVLAGTGFFPPTDLETLNKPGSHYIGHPTRHVNGVEQNTGGLGHGLSFAVGLALALRSKGHRVFTLLGDGELAEGSNWEAAMTASHYQLDNLVVIIDRNKLQITGPTEKVVSLEPLEEKFLAFGFALQDCDGNSITDLQRAFSELPYVKGRPNLIMAHTTKGAGISFMENTVKWHHHVTSEEEFQLAMDELDAAKETITTQEGVLV